MFSFFKIAECSFDLNGCGVRFNMTASIGNVLTKAYRFVQGADGTFHPLGQFQTLSQYWRLVEAQ
jgi:hypothetical protein